MRVSLLRSRGTDYCIGMPKVGGDNIVYNMSLYLSLPEVVSCRLDRVLNRCGNMSVSFSFASVTLIGVFICMVLTTLSNVSYGRCK